METNSIKDESTRGEEMALSDLTSLSTTSSSPGIIPQLSKGMSISEQDSISSYKTVTRSKPHLRPHPVLLTSPLDTLSKQQQTPSLRCDLSDLYPGVHDLLRTIPFKVSKSTKQAPPLLIMPNNINDNVPYKPILAPPNLNPPIPLYLMPHSNDIIKITPPVFNQAPPSNIQASNQVLPTNLQAPLIANRNPPTNVQMPPTNMPHPLKEWVELVLPNIPVKPFVPKLRPRCHDDRRRLPLLQINDQVSHMKQEGFPLLWLPREQGTTIRNKQFKKRKRERKIKFQTIPSPPPPPPPPPLSSSSESLTEIIQTSLNNDSLPSLTLPSNKPLPSHSSSPPPLPSNKSTPPLSPSIKSPSPLPSNKPSPPPSPSNEPLPPHTQLSLRRMEMESLYVENDTPTQLPTTPTHSVSHPPTHSIAIQVDVNNDTCNTHQVIDDTLNERKQDTEIINDSNNEDEQILTIIEHPSPSPSPPPITVTSGPVNTGQNSVLKQFLHLERQLSLLEHTAQDMRDDFITSRRMLDSIDRLNTSNNANHNSHGSSPVFNDCLGNNSDYYGNEGGYHSNMDDYHGGPFQEFKFSLTSDTVRSDNISNRSERTTVSEKDKKINTCNEEDKRRNVREDTCTNIEIKQSEEKGVRDKNKIELRRWMSQKFQSRQFEYKNERNQLRMKERKPFQSSSLPSTPRRKTSGQSNPSTPHQRRIKEEKDHETRLQEAQDLMNDLLSSHSKLKSTINSVTCITNNSRTSSRAPSQGPSRVPSKVPSRTPSRAPSRTPSQGPSRVPSRAPSRPHSADNSNHRKHGRTSTRELSATTERIEKGKGRERERRQGGGGGYNRRISSVEGLSIQEQDRIADILANTVVRNTKTGDNSETSAVSSIDWEEVDNLLS